MSEDLKRCPFCGGHASIREVTPVHDTNVKAYGYGGYYPMCDDCLTTGNNYASYWKAADAWNRRVKNED